LWRWRQVKEFQARVDEISRQLDAECLRIGIARKVNRLRRLDDRARRIQRLIDARAADPDIAALPGGETGLVVRREKSIGSDPAAQLVTEAEADVALLRELREIEKQAAIELGQWEETAGVKAEVTVKVLVGAVGHELAHDPVCVERCDAIMQTEHGV